MQNFVREKSGGAASPQNGQPFSRRQQAANLKVKPGDALTYRAQQNQSNRAPNRGEHRAALAQPQPQQPHHQLYAQQSYDHDPYGTDAGSIDTTIDHSTVKLEESQMSEDEPIETLDDEVEDEGDYDDDESAQEGDEYDEASEFQYEQGDADAQDPVFANMSDKEILKLHNQEHLPQAMQMEVLRNLRGTRSTAYLAQIEGDSYPSTTDGEPSQWKESQGPLPQGNDYGVPAMPMHQQPQIKQLASQPLPQQSVYRAHSPQTVPAGRITPDPQKIFTEGASIRKQQRNETDLRAHDDPTRRGDSVSQPANHLAIHGPAASQFPQGPTQANALPARGSRQAPQNPQIVVPAPQAVNSHNHSNPFVPAPTHTNIIGNGQQVENLVVEDQNLTPICDYDSTALSGMSYDALKDESFDKDPRAESPVLSDEMIGKPLPERLEFVRKNLDGARQSTFFNSLPTAEWEDAGDWFLDQFSSIIKRSREARQKKRKLAHEFEGEVEKRHQHVSKKQQQVEDAMAKMKAQGEGLMPKSPRAPKTPKTLKV